MDTFLIPHLRQMPSKMKLYFFILFALFASGSCQSTREVSDTCSTCSNNLYVNYIKDGNLLTCTVYSLLSDALSLLWSIVNIVVGLLSGQRLCCPADKSVCGIYDSNGLLIGVQIAILVQKVSTPAYEMHQLGYTQWKPDILGPSYWCIKYMKSPEGILSLGSWNPIISVDLNVALGSGVFTKQGCLPGMGQSYFYNLNSQTQCDAQSLCPFFILADKSKAIGFCTIYIANILSTPSTNGNQWQMQLTQENMQQLIPNGPQCLKNLANNPGIWITCVYFEEPGEIDCGSL